MEYRRGKGLDVICKNERNLEVVCQPGAHQDATNGGNPHDGYDDEYHWSRRRAMRRKLHDGPFLLYEYQIDTFCHN